MKKTALISVSDKSGITEFGKKLETLGYQIISTGGTFHTLQEAGIKNLLEISDFTKFPEGLDGRIKTLTPQVFGGILNLRNNNKHQQFCKDNKIKNIDLVIVNLYPFKSTYENPNKNFAEKIEQIDIGGPSMIRAAAKNYEYCTPIVDPEDYTWITNTLEKNGNLTLDQRKQLATKVFEITTHYDLMIARFWKENTTEHPLRYGENPHQSAVVLNDPFTDGSNLVNAKILNGKPLSFNNLNDANGALELTISFDQPFATIIKHATPCGAAIGKTIEDAFTKAYEADSLSAFGGVICINREVSKKLAEKIISFFNEIVIAPKVSEEALEIFKTKPNLRILEVPNFSEKTNDVTLRKVRGGTLVQDLDVKDITKSDIKNVTKTKPTSDQITDMLTAWKIVKIVKSNAIVVVKNGVMIGKGGGQTSRVEAMDIALNHAGKNAKGAVIASDAFFPFPDAIELAGKHEISAIIQPGGSKKDEDVITKCDELDLAMVFTETRAFLH